MKRYTITEALRSLGIYRQQFWKLCEISGIVPKAAEALRNDAKSFALTPGNAKTISADELEELRGYLIPGVTIDDTALDEVVMLVRQMRAEMDTMKRRIEALEAGLPPKGEARLTSRKYTGFTQRDEPPSGLVYRARFAEAHGIPGGTAKGHTEAGILHETTMPHPTRANETNHFFNAEQQAAAVAYWRTHSAGFEACPDCPHEART